ncbi:MAG: hypothetical protein E6H55_10675 [Betaproteobacteria bacterium]|nr:MAG: hypothetical protein E6H55_10675 [Betaproteobacteria bacterium]
MSYAMACIAVFLGAYLINIFYITVFYHRGLAHRSVTLKPWTRRFVIWTGNWVTAIDPKAWVCMHRMHHQFADTLLDPHSPLHSGLWNLMLVQLCSYERTLACLRELAQPQPALVPAVPASRDDRVCDRPWLRCAAARSGVLVRDHEPSHPGLDGERARPSLWLRQFREQ